MLTLGIGYFLFAIGLKELTQINILPPCLWKTLFHHPCPGCGLTTAFTKLLHFDFPGAFHSNPLIFIVLVLGIYLISDDFIKFVGKKTKLI